MWMHAEGLGIGALDERVLAGFAQHLRHCACLRRNHGRYTNAIAGARHFLAHSRARGVVAVPPVSAARALPGVLEHFEEWMRCHRGIAERTLQGYRPILLDLLRQVALSTYLGHAQLAHTYWYLHVTPQLMTGIADSCQAYLHRGTP